MTTRAPGDPLLVARLVWGSLLVAPALYCGVLVLLLRSGAGGPKPALADSLRTILLVLAVGQTLAVWFVWNHVVAPSDARDPANRIDPQRAITMHVVCWTLCEAIAVAEAGADVACAARATDSSPLKLPGTIDATVREVEARGRRGLSVPTDLSRPAEVEAMVAQTIGHFGRLDVLVNNAAITFAGDIDLAMKRWDLVMEVNLRAPVLAINRKSTRLNSSHDQISYAV